MPQSQSIEHILYFHKTPLVFIPGKDTFSTAGSNKHRLEMRTRQIIWPGFFFGNDGQLQFILTFAKRAVGQAFFLFFD